MSETRSTKVAKVLDKYDLDGLGVQLEEAWTAERGERTSLRDLAAEFNEEVLRAALKGAGGSPLNFEVAGTYEMLSDGSEPEATRARRRLEREGIDTEELEGDFVTHQAIHTYLTKVREATLPENETDLVDRKIETIEKLQGRLTAVTESALGTLDSAGKLDRSDYDVLVGVRTVCPACGSDTAAGELLRNGGCGCDTNDDL
ncbi:rod-determining factor RdfA [Halorubrum sp. DTA46]|uniref:rod-determining factor RdfA n=1 Tax=Halorubrum sp. DTA46 TaxID=3402162 RepID=UPI003AAECA85